MTERSLFDIAIPERRFLFDVLKLEPGEDFMWSSFSRCEAKDICARVRSLYALGWDDIDRPYLLAVVSTPYPVEGLQILASPFVDEDDHGTGGMHFEPWCTQPVHAIGNGIGEFRIKITEHLH